MVCRTCGTEIADKAIICYRCGTATPAFAAPAASAGKAGEKAGRGSVSGMKVWIVIGVVAILAVAAYYWLRG